MTKNKKLYRSVNDKIIAGVCGGLGEYFDVDPTLIRIIFVLITLIDGIGLVLYLIMALIVPKRGGSNIKANAAELSGQARQLAANFKNSSHGRSLLGTIIVFTGLLILIKNLMPDKLEWFQGEVLWSCLIIAIGLYLILRNKPV